METNIEEFRKDPIIPIGAAAALIGVSPSTLRMYETEGLIIPYKTATKMRLYTQEDIEWIQCIRQLIKQEKLGVEGIRRLLSLIPCWKVKNGPEEVKKSCKAYSKNDIPCWRIKTEKRQHLNVGCRLCTVYRNARQAFDTKKMLTAYINY